MYHGTIGWAKNVQKSWYTKTTLKHTWWDLKGSQKVIRWLSWPILPRAKQAECQGWARCIWKSHGSHFLARKWKSMWKSHILSNLDFMKKKISGFTAQFRCSQYHFLNGRKQRKSEPQIKKQFAFNMSDIKNAENYFCSFPLVFWQEQQIGFLGRKSTEN